MAESGYQQEDSRVKERIARAGQWFGETLLPMMPCGRR